MNINSSKPIFDKGKNSLHRLVNQITTRYLPHAVQQRSFFINDIPPHLYLQVNNQIPAAILNTVIFFVSRCCAESCIRIDATESSNLLVTKVNIYGLQNPDNILPRLQAVQVFARKINGELKVRSDGHRRTNISFSFLNMKNTCLLFNEVNIRDVSFINYMKAS